MTNRIKTTNHLELLPNDIITVAICAKFVHIYALYSGT